MHLGARRVSLRLAGKFESFRIFHIGTDTQYDLCRGGDSDLAEAIRLSKAEADEQAARSRRGGKADADLEEAMRLSREDDERRRRELTNQSGIGLFDDQQCVPFSGSTIGDCADQCFCHQEQ